MFFLELIIEVYVLFEDLVFARKKKARRKFEKENGLPKKVMIHPLVFYFLAAIIIAVFTVGIYGFVISPMLRKNELKRTKNKLTELRQQIDDSFKRGNKLPVYLFDFVNKNPLEHYRLIDAWGNEFYYKRSENKLDYVLISKGKDGVLYTKDDIK